MHSPQCVIHASGIFLGSSGRGTSVSGYLIREESPTKGLGSYRVGKDLATIFDLDVAHILIQDMKGLMPDLQLTFLHVC